MAHTVSAMEASEPHKQPADDAAPEPDLGYDPSKPIMTLGDLLDSDLVGMWKDRTDITDSSEWARALRDKHQRRGTNR